MRTYDDTFSGQKIYPGKVRHLQRVRRASEGTVALAAMIWVDAMMNDILFLGSKT